MTAADFTRPNSPSDAITVARVAARLSAILSSSSDAILTHDLDGRIIDWNTAAERTFGYMAGEIVGQPASILAPPDLSDELKQSMERLLRGERVADFQSVRIHKDGRRLDLSLAISPIVDDEGRVLGVCQIARDI